MKYIFTFLLIVTTSILGFCQATQTSFPDSGFEANFPANPTLEKNQLTTKFGKIDYTLYMSEGDDYMIMLTESKYPAEVISKLGEIGTQGIIDGAKKGSIKVIESQLEGKFVTIKDENIKYLDKYIGNNLEGDVDDVAIISTSFIKDNQMYQIIVFGNVTSKKVLDFIASFKLL